MEKPILAKPLEMRQVFAALTGESRPRAVRPGDEVISGCVNADAVLRIRTTKLYGESTVAKILDLVENSSLKKAPVENFITKFARYYTPAVCIAALVLAVVPPLFLGGWLDWIMRALTFLVISCPCASKTAHDRTSFTVNTAFYLLSVYRAFSFLKRIPRFKYSDF